MLNRLALAAMVVVCAHAAPAQSSSVPLTTYTVPFSNLIDSHGPDVESDRWWMRKTIGQIMDFLSTPAEDLSFHPLVHPEVGPFLSYLHHVRLNRVIEKLQDDPPPVSGVRLFKLYSSGWIIQGPSYTVAVDYSDGPFFPNVVAPNLVPVTTTQLDQLANLVDAYFVSHSHIDHVSPYLASAMVAQGKPVYVPIDLYIAAVLSGMPNATALAVPPYDTQIDLAPGVKFTAFNGFQYGAFLDPEHLVPDQTNNLNVPNNSYIIEVDGVGVAHFGDNNDAAIIPWAQQRAVEGWDVDVTMNLGLWGSDITDLFGPSQCFLSHELEYHHFGPGFLNLNIGDQPDPARRVLFWGEHLDVAPE